MSYHPAPAVPEAPFAIPSGTPDRFEDVTIVTDTHATMRDRVRLGADVYLPRGGTPAPTVLIRLPYGKQTPDMGMFEVGCWLARKGYACVVQDVRGKFSSEGQFDPGVNEIEDGYDTVEWAIAQPWSNGIVGLWGESYYGFTSYAAAVSAHPAIRAIAPGDIGVDRRAVWFRQGAFPLNTTGYWTMAMDAPEYADVTRIDPYHLPLIDMARAAGLDGSFFRAVITEAEHAEWWARRSLTGKLGKIRCAVLSWSGWYDNYLGAQLRDLTELRAAHPSPEHVHLMVGPWDHEGSAGDVYRAACIRLPETARHRWDAYQAFFDRYLRNEDNGFGRRGSVDLFTIGRNEWRSAGAWPPSAMRPMPVYLRAGGLLSFDPPSASEPPDRYCYDPQNPVEETVGGNCWALCTTLGDRRRHEERPDILRYCSEPLASDLELAGPISMRLYAASSAVDTDFTVSLCHVLPDGSVSPIQDGIVRARYRDGMDRTQLLTPGEVERYALDLYATSYLVPAGDRLRVDISSSCFDRYDRNPNTADPFGLATRTAVAEQSVYHTGQLASHVVLPVVAGSLA